MSQIRCLEKSYYHGINRLMENFYIKNEEGGSNEENCR